MKAWRETGAFFVMLIGLAIAVSHLASCAVFTKPNARGALDVVQMACAIENATMADEKVAEVCGVADALLPVLRSLLASHRAALARAQHAGACRDAGPDGSP